LRVLNDPRDAEDVAQEVFVMIWEKAKLYDPSKGKPLTWAVTMTRNKAIDKLRSLQRRFRLREELEKRNHPYEWLVKEKEGHGFYKPENNVERWQKMLAFFDKYIGESKPL
jgi:RNA polymerase sigma factor (sigma-70 family)